MRVPRGIRRVWLATASMEERALAYIATIDEIRPIPNYDRVEHARVKGWWTIVKKEEFKVGDKCVYFETDAMVPAYDKRFEFLEPRHYKIKIQRMCKVYSEGLAMPISEFPELTGKEVDENVTDILKVTYASADDRKRKLNKVDPNAKYKSMAARHPDIFKKPLVKKMMRHEWGKKFLFLIFGRKKDNPRKFPSWIQRTDEVRVENIPYILENTDKWISSEKADGSSETLAVEWHPKEHFWQKGYWEFFVCSRNVRQADRNQECYHDSNIYWEMADKYHAEDALKKIANEFGCRRVVIQGEAVGNVQGNPYKLKENDLYVFNLILDGKRLGSVEARDIVTKYGFKFVPLLDLEHELPHTMEEMKDEAEGMSVINPKVKREGIVYRSPDGQQSFKNVSRSYQLKHSNQQEE